MFGQKKQEQKGSWGKQAGQQDGFWGDTQSTGREPVQPNQVAQSIPNFRADDAPENLLELVEPVFQFICGLHRVDREGKELVYSQVRSECESLLDQVERNARKGAVLQRQFEKLKDPMLWYIDYWFGSSGDFKTIRSQWNRDRMGEYQDDGDADLSGDDSFFDEVDKTLSGEVSDEETNERLAFFYTAIGLGFTGSYFKAIPEHQNKLRDYMDRLYPRVQKYVDTSANHRVTPESYKYTDKRDFIAPLQDRPLILMLAGMFLIASLFFGYMWFYGNHKTDLERQIDDVLHTSNQQELK